MGYMFVLGTCCTCGILFTFNADWVPSVNIDGERLPVCKDCVTRANRGRQEQGLDVFYVHPDAYEPSQCS